MNIWEILQIIWEKKIRKRLYPYSAHWARDRHGPAQLHGCARAVDAGGVLGGNTPSPSEGVSGQSPCPLNEAGPSCQVRPPPPARVRQETEEALDAGRRRYRASPAMFCPPACSGDPAASNRGWHGRPGAPGRAGHWPRRTRLTVRLGHGAAAAEKKKWSPGEGRG